MKSILILSTLALTGCATAFAGEKSEPIPPDVAMMANAKPERVSIDTKLLDAVKQFLQTSNIESLRTCQANPRFWFCRADNLLAGITKDAKPCLECNADNNKAKGDNKQE